MPLKIRHLGHFALQCFLGTLFLLAATAGQAQTLTTVTGTVTDPNGIPYAGARLSIALISPGGRSPELTPCTNPGAGCQIQNPGSVTLDGNGSIPAGGISLWANASILPAGTTYSFTVTLSPGVAPPWGTGPQTFTVNGIIIAGATQDLSATLTGPALALTRTPPGGTPAAPDTCIQINKSGAFGVATSFCLDSSAAPTMLTVPFNLHVKGNGPWTDIVAYGARVRSGALPTTTATTSAGSGAVTLAAAIAGQKNGDWMVIYTAGNPTTQSTPAAPTATAQGLTGASTYNYQCVGVDASDGLTAASAVGSATNVAVGFGALASNISTMTHSAGTVSGTLATAQPNGTFQSTISGATGDTSVNGVFSVTITTGTSYSYSVAGSGSPVVTSAKFRLTPEAANITAINRTSDGVIHGTTAVNNNFAPGTGQNPVKVILTGVTPADLLGEYVLASAAGTSFTTTATGNRFAETGTVSSASYAIVQANISVACPALAGTTVEHLVYGDDGTGTYYKMGLTPRGNHTWLDWGHYNRTATPNGFQTPSYMPATPPVAAQNQLYVGQVTAGAATTNITVSPVVPSAVAGATAMPDDYGALQAAANAACPGGTSTSYSGVFIPPADVNGGYYAGKSPVTLPVNCNLLVGSLVNADETIFGMGGNKVKGWGAASGVQAIAQFYSNSVPFFIGKANPFVDLHVNSSLEDLGFASGAVNNPNDGQILAMFNAAETAFGGKQATQPKVRNLVFDVGSATTSVGLVFQGATSGVHIEDMTCKASWPNAPTGSLPTNQAPPLGCVWFKGDDQNSYGYIAGSVVWSGFHMFNGRGILLDVSQGSPTQTASGWVVGDAFWNQQPVTPMVMINGAGSGGGPYGLTIRNYLGDSAIGTCLGNWSAPTMVLLDNCASSVTNPSTPIVQGGTVSDLRVRQPNMTTQPVGQNVNMAADAGASYFDIGNAGGREFGGYNFHARPLVFPPYRNYPEAWAFQPPGQPAAAASGVGTITAGTYYYAMTFGGWNTGDGGAHWGESQLSPIFAGPVTLNGSQGVQITPAAWPVAGAQGYYAYQCTSQTWNTCSQFTTLQTGSSATFTSNPTGNTAPFFDGTGTTGFDQNRAWAPELDLTNGQWKAAVAAGTLTASRSYALPDASGTVGLAQTGYLTSAYTNATTTPSNITGLSFSVAANTKYSIVCNLYFQGSVNTAGLDITITGPAAPTSVFYSLDEDSTSATNINSVASAFGTKLVAQNVTATTNLHAMVTLGLLNGANAGTVQVQGSATGAGTVTVQAGSTCRMMQ